MFLLFGCAFVSTFSIILLFVDGYFLSMSTGEQYQLLHNIRKNIVLVALVPDSSVHSNNFIVQEENLTAEECQTGIKWYILFTILNCMFLSCQLTCNSHVLSRRGVEESSGPVAVKTKICTEEIGNRWSIVVPLNYSKCYVLIC